MVSPTYAGLLNSFSMISYICSKTSSVGGERDGEKKEAKEATEGGEEG